MGVTNEFVSSERQTGLEQKARGETQGRKSKALQGQQERQLLGPSLLSSTCPVGQSVVPMEGNPVADGCSWFQAAMRG